jgi:UDP-N-acetylmuramate dehydrogenase
MRVASRAVPAVLADLTTLRLGGPAARMVTATSADELVDAVRTADGAHEPVLIVGGGSNLVVADDGWPGVVVLIRSDQIDLRNSGTSVIVTAQAGVAWDELVELTVREGYCGLEPMSGIPGRAGATPIQNVNAYGGAVADVIVGLTVLDRESGAVETWPPERCEFGFRTSAFKYTDRFVILDVTFELQRSEVSGPVRYAELARRLGVELGQPAMLGEVRETVLGLRRSKGMLLDPDDHDTWSVGSFFINPIVAPELVPDECPNWPAGDDVKLSAAWLIENSGFHKGFAGSHGRGSVSVSTKHTLALTNRGDGTTAELLDLATEIRAGVEARFGIRLLPEAHLAGVDF